MNTHAMDLRVDVPGDVPHAVRMNERLQRGMAAELAAAAFLESQGVTLLARNLRCRAGELDLVGLDREVLIVVEVRFRRRRDFGGALASVGATKQRRLIRAALYHWQRRPNWRRRIMRFDVVAFDTVPGQTPHPLWLKDAFRAT